MVHILASALTCTLDLALHLPPLTSDSQRENHGVDGDHGSDGGAVAGAALVNRNSAQAHDHHPGAAM